MATKVMAVLRTLVLIGLALYTTSMLPLGAMFAGATTRDATSFKIEVVEAVARAAWLAIGWIALETVFGWIKVGWGARASRKELEARQAAARAALDPKRAP